MIHGGRTWTKRTSWVVFLIANGLCELLDHKLELSMDFVNYLETTLTTNEFCGLLGHTH
jgi:hypothetical protein